MKVLVLNGSPKKISDTMCLTTAFLDGLNDRNVHEIEIVNVIEKKIAPCHGCFGCWAKGDGQCVINDDQNAILRKIIETDLIVISFPLYCYGLPSHLKAVIDRLIPLVQMKMKEENGVVRHLSFFDFSRLKTVMISGCGFPNSEGNFDAAKLIVSKCFPNLTSVCVPETPLMNIAEATPVSEPKRALFCEAGKEYDLTGALSSGTVQALESLMIPNDEYIRRVNGGSR
ncbi:MAG: flavodoxin family protein [Clostridia bacterium]|nr:flavodoxin family protein [Clostridia bacterium]